MEVATRRREQEVWQACDDLWALYGDMRHVTGDGIRERLLSLGKSKGSPNEIYKYRKTWFVSRGITSTSADNASSGDDNDPITRAVRLVHEQLKDSTENRIEALKQQFAEELAEKDAAITKARAALDQVLGEFGALEQKLTAVNVENKNLSQQLAAEIDVRRALEKEMQLQKSLHAQDKHHHETRIAELESSFAAELARIKSRDEEVSRVFEQQIREQNERLQNQGHDYSERLMVVKTALLNQEIVTQQLESKIKTTLENLRQKEAELRAMQERLVKEEALVREQTIVLRTKNDEIATLKNHQCTLKHELAKRARELTRAGTSIARLRAYIAHSPGRTDGLS